MTEIFELLVKIAKQEKVRGIQEYSINFYEVPTE